MLFGWLKSLSPITIEEVRPLPDRAESGAAPTRAELDLDKAWHGLQFLFTNTAWEGDEPACFLVKGGREIGDEEVGYSMPRLLDPPQVRAARVFFVRSNGPPAVCGRVTGRSGSSGRTIRQANSRRARIVSVEHCSPG